MVAILNATFMYVQPLLIQNLHCSPVCRNVVIVRQVTRSATVAVESVGGLMLTELLLTVNKNTGKATASLLPQPADVYCDPVIPESNTQS